MLKELRTQHRNILHMHFNGFSNNEIAEKMEISHITVSQVIRSPLGQAYIHGLQDRAQEATLDVRKQLISLNKNALATFTRLLDPATKAPPSVQFNTAKDVLDRNGYKAPDKLNIDMTLQSKTDAEIEAEIIAMERAINITHSKQGKVESQESQEQLDETLGASVSINENTSETRSESNSETGDSLNCISSLNSEEESTIKFNNPDTISEESPVSDLSASDLSSAVNEAIEQVNSPEELPEESLINNIPPDLFQSNTK